MLYGLRARIKAELYGIRFCFMAALFIVLAFFISGIISARSADPDFAVGFLAGRKTLFAVFFALMLRRIIPLLLSCLSGCYVFAAPVTLFMLLFYCLGFSLVWSVLLMREGYAALPFIVLPALIVVFCAARLLAHIFSGYAVMIKLRHIPKTPYDMFMLSKDSFTVCLKSAVLNAFGCAVEAVAVCILSLS